MSRFLRYVVEASLARDESRLKESIIGVEVFDRQPTYDPKTDPVVRSEARRLREKIQRYYEREGALDSVQVVVPKGGYVAQFAFREKPAPFLQIETLPPEAPQCEVDGRFRRWRWLALGLVAGVQLGVGALSLVNARNQGVNLQPQSVYPLTGLPGQELDATISPDGKQVVFVWDGDRGDFDLYAVPARGGQPRRLTATPDRDMHPAYSPDGARIAFLRASPDAIEVWMIGANGEDPTKLSEIRTLEWFNWRSDLLTSTGYPGPSWAPDGRSLILGDAAGSQQGAALWEFELATGARRQITRPTKLAHDFFPAVSPDGTRVAFVRQSSASVSDVYVVDRRSGREQRITNDGREVRGLAWLPDSRTLLFSSARNNAQQLWTVAAVAGAKPTAFAAPGGSVLGPAVSRDGRLLVFTAATVNLNLWRQRLGPSVTGEAAIPVALSTGANMFPRYSPDGRKLAWASDRTGGWEIWVANADGSGAVQMTQLAEKSNGRMLGTPRWSPDGKWIAFDARVRENCAIFVMEARSGAEPRLLEENTWEERNPSFSRDGQWVYFNSNRGGLVQIWKRRADGSGPAVRVTRHRGYDAAESADGGELYFLPALSEPGIWRAPADGSGEEALLATLPYFARRHWDVAGGRIYFVGHNSEPRTLFRYDPRRQELVQVARLEHDLLADTNGLTVSPDEQWVVISRADILRSDLIAVRLAGGVDAPGRSALNPAPSGHPSSKPQPIHQMDPP